MPRRSILLFAGACVAIAAALATVTVIVVQGRERADGMVEGTSDILSSVGGPFQLVNQQGQPVDQTLLDGKWSLVFFGFTYCPDYCPTTLTSLEATRQLLGPDASDIQIVFISIDPERDTPEALKTYLESDGFPPGVIGLTGTQQQVADAAKAYRASFQKVGDGEDYTMNHTLTVYLVGPDGRTRSVLSHDLGPERSAQLIRRVKARG